MSSFRLAFCVENILPYYRDILRGVEKVLAAEDGVLLPWLGREQVPLAALEYLEPDGILLGPVREEQLPSIPAALPRIGFSNRYEQGVRPRVVNDDEATGRMAVDALQDAGYRSVALLMQPGYWHTDLRARGVETRCGVAGLPLVTFDMNLRKVREGETFREVWKEHRQALRSFLKALPANCGLVAINAEQAHEVLVMIRDELGRRVPEDLGLILVDMPLPSEHSPAFVRLNGEEVGRRATRRLLMRLRGKPDHTADIETVVPLEVDLGTTLRINEVRQLYLKLTAWSQAHLSEPIKVEDLCRVVGMSRRSLEMKLHQQGLPPPYEILTELRLEKAKTLLKETRLRMEDLAEQCGFNDARAFRKRFQAHTGMSPRDWRRTSS